MATFDTPGREVDLPTGQGPQCISVPVMKQVNRDPESMPKNYRMFVTGKDRDKTQVYMTISRNVRKSATLIEILELSVAELVTDPNLKRDPLSGDLVFTTNFEDAGEVQELVDAINREFNYKRQMLKEAQRIAK